MLEGEDIIIVGQQAWDVEIGSNCKNIAIELCKQNRVLYVNPPLDRISKIRAGKDAKIFKRTQVIKGKVSGLENIGRNLWVFYPEVMIESINWLPSHKLFAIFNYRNNKMLAGSIRRIIEKLDFSNFILFNDSDMFRSFYLKELLKPLISIYYSRDNLLATHYWRRHGIVFEPKIIAKSDLCFANSEYLKDYCALYNSRSHYVGQGCEVELFRTERLFEIPKDIDIIASPIIGYIGALTASRLDLDLLEHIAKKLPKYEIVLVGPEDKVFEKSALHSLKNVTFLGRKDPEELPNYIRSFDVCINPQVVNGLTIGNYPRKVDEYLAMGKPVVATKTLAMKSFEDYCFLADGYSEFVEMIERALSQNDPDTILKRKEFACSHTWENSVKIISYYVSQYLRSRV